MMLRAHTCIASNVLADVLGSVNNYVIPITATCPLCSLAQTAFSTHKAWAAAAAATHNAADGIAAAASGVASCSPASSSSSS
jgi:hypothetical protein